MSFALLRRIAIGSGALTIALTTALGGVALADESPGRGELSGTLYFDANGNGKYDQGEGLAGVRITLFGGTPYRDDIVQTTDSAGQFAFVELTYGHYGVDSMDGLGDLVGQ